MLFFQKHAVPFFVVFTGLIFLSTISGCSQLALAPDKKPENNSNEKTLEDIHYDPDFSFSMDSRKIFSVKITGDEINRKKARIRILDNDKVLYQGFTDSNGNLDSELNISKGIDGILIPN
jgi:hypothetical protein